MDKKTIAIGVPCYNEEKSIPVFIDAFLKNEDIKKLEAKYKFIFIFVDDGSTDKTQEILEKTSQERDDFYFISFDHNRGKESGLVAIYDAAISLKVDALIKMDVDLQDPPNLIPKFVEDWERGYIYIYGHSNGRKGQKFIKKFFSSSFYKVYSWVSLEWGMKDGDRDFSLMNMPRLKVLTDSIDLLGHISKSNQNLSITILLIGPMEPRDGLSKD